LWSQEDLIAEREKYGANDIKPGITGWAQINGRDELEIDVKAKFDGEYAAALNAGRFRGLVMDMKCLFGTVVCVLKSEGVVEGGTGEMKKKAEREVTAK
jgi:O-antigen biosynthesis protein WbqP